MRITFIKTGKRVKPKERLFKNKLKNNEEKRIFRNKLKNSEAEKINQSKKKTSATTNKTNENSVLKNIFRKNQIVILTLALMLFTAGYMNYSNNSNENEIQLAELGDAKLVSADVTDENTSEVSSENLLEENTVVEEKNVIEQDKTEINQIEVNNQNETKETSTVENNENYFTQTRLERETMYSQMIETYQKLIQKEEIQAEQKAIAVNEIKNINDRKNAISIIENLIKTKGFKDVVLLINDNNINVIVKNENNLTDEQVAQITNIVSRELKAEIENIHISIHK